MPKVSVIIPSFGAPSFLKNAIQSVLNQTLTDFELIIVDDNEPNTKERAFTEKLVEKFQKSDHRIIYTKHDKNRNGSAARNTGLKIAKGKYIAFLDSDDEYYPKRLEKCFYKMVHSSKKIAGVYTGCEFKKQGKTFNVYKNAKPGNFLVETLAATFKFGTGSNIFFRRNVIEELGGFDEAFERHQDYEFLVRVFEKYSIEAIPEVLVIKNNENFNVPDVEQMITIKEKYLKKFEPIILNLDKRDQNYIYHSQYISIAEQALRTGKYEIARKYYKYANDYGDFTLKERFRKNIFILLSLFNKK